jgi:site-specific DNA-cytosine methylase
VRHCSIFAGIDAVGLAVRALGGETVAYSEFDPAPISKKKPFPRPLEDQYNHKILRKRLPDALALGDVTKVDWKETQREAPFSFASAGFPCQDLSAAGKGGGLDGARSGLYVEVIRMIREARPELVLVENVPRLLGLHFERLLRDLRDEGYDCEWDVISAAAVGAPHLRERLWLLAYQADDSLPAPRAMGPVKKISALSVDDDGVKWPRAGMMISGQVFELVPIAPRKTKRVDGRTYWVGVNLMNQRSGLLYPTPTSADSRQARNNKSGRTNPDSSHHSGTTLSPSSLAAIVDGIEKGLWPSPRSSDGSNGLRTVDGALKEVERGTNFNLSAAVALSEKGLWPTPTSTLGSNGGLVTPEKAREGGTLIEALSNRLWPTLHGMAKPDRVPGPSGPEAVDRRLWPTVSTADGHGGPGTSPQRVGGENLRTAVAKEQRGSLNPNWCEWLMALPVGWTDVDCDDPVYLPFSQEPLPRVVKECPNRRQRLHAIGNSLVWLIPYLLLLRLRERCGYLPGEGRS